MEKDSDPDHRLAHLRFVTAADGFYSGPLTCLSLSSDGNIAAVGSRDMTVKLVSIPDKKMLHSFFGYHSSSVTAVQFSHDDKFIASCAYDGRVNCFWVASKTPKFIYVEQTNDYLLQELAISPDSKLIAVGTRGNRIFLLDAEKGIIQSVFKYQNGGIFALAFSPDNKYLVSGSQDYSLSIIDPHGKKLVTKLNDLQKSWISSVAISPSGKQIATGADREIKIISTDTFEELFMLHRLHKDWITDICFSADGKLLASCSHDKSVNIIEFEKKELLHSLDYLHQGIIYGIRFFPDGKRFITASADNSMKIIDVNTTEELYSFKNVHKNSVSCLAITPDCSTLISGSFDKTIKIIDIETMKITHELINWHRARILLLAVSPDGRLLASCCENSIVKVCELSTRKALGSMQNLGEEKDQNVLSLCFTPDSSHLVYTRDDNLVIFLELKKFTVAHQVLVQDLWSIVKPFKSQNAILACTVDNYLQQMSCYNRKIVFKMPTPSKHTVSEMVLSADEKFLVIGSHDSSILLLETKTMKPCLKMSEPFEKKIFSITFASMKSLRIATGYNDNMIKIWDLLKRKIINEKKSAHADSIFSLVYSHNTSEIIAGDNHGVIAGHSLMLFDGK